MEDPEHQRGWRAVLDVDGREVRVEARHHSRMRPPRGGEISCMLGRGRPLSLVEEVSHEWAVLHGGVPVCTLRQYPSGEFHAGGLMDFLGHDIEDAAAKAFRSLRPTPGTRSPGSIGP